MGTFCTLLALWENPSVIGGFLSQRPVMQSFDVFFDLCPNKWLSKASFKLELPVYSAVWGHRESCTGAESQNLQVVEIWHFHNISIKYHEMQVKWHNMEEI